MVSSEYTYDLGLSRTLVELFRDVCYQAVSIETEKGMRTFDL
jgi:hypothetical protein